MYTHIYDIITVQPLAFLPNLLPNVEGYAVAPQLQPIAEESDYNGILYAVPKKRRTIERRRKITFGFDKRMEYAQPKDNIITCPACGGWHESHTICGELKRCIREDNY